MSSYFIHESDVYKLLLEHGIRVPKFATIKEKSSLCDIDDLPFHEGELVVVKGLANNLWHKSDEGALHFIPFSKNEVALLDKNMRDRLGQKYSWIETMVCSRSNFKISGGLPSEGFVSIQQDDACGTVISFGVGGIYAEAWALELNSNVLMWSPDLTTPEEALNEITHHWLGKVWLGELRQGKALTDSNKLLQFLHGLWNLAKKINSKNIKLLEMNPIVIDEDGHPIALDGVGTYEHESHETRSPIEISPEALLAPKKIAIAGVSEKASSFGRKILENLLQSSISIDDIKIIKPGTKEFLGITCYPDIKNLLDTPVDILILALPAAGTVQTLIELCEQGSGAQIIYLVAGGIGDSGDTTGLATQVHHLLNSRRTQGLWTPALIGPNALGVILAPKKINSLFISPEKLPITFHPNGNIALVSQSGAFFITRFSREERLPIKYGFCIGNQMDLKVSDFLNIIGTDKNIKIIGAYLEGFSTGEVLRFAKTAKNLILSGKHVILYKGGRSEEGMMAAAGHTGAMAGNYELQKKILLKAGIYITENFLEFSSVLHFLSIYPNYQYSSKIAILSNAGFETVASADHLGSNRKDKRQNKIMPLSDSVKIELQAVFEKHGLASLVGATNPLDLTPMADEEAYLASIEVFARSDAEAILFCAIPLTDKLNTVDLPQMSAFAKRLQAISLNNAKPILVIIDSGKLFDNFREAFKDVGLPTFSSIEEAFLALKYKKGL